MFIEILFKMLLFKGGVCSGFTLVVNLFNKDDAEDGGLSFFILQKHRAQIIWTHVSLLHSGSR